jgi:hypothetical protein
MCRQTYLNWINEFESDTRIEKKMFIISPTLHWARVVGYGPFSLFVIYREGLCPSSRDINRLMMMIMSLLCT